MQIQQFRETVYQQIAKRADATLDLIDALTAAGQVASPVALSEEAAFQRQFSSVYDVLEAGRLDRVGLADVLYAAQPEESEEIGGYAVYALDATRNERPTAETAAERGYLKSQTDEVASVGYKFSWLVRLVKWRTSWVAPQDVQRITPVSTDAATAVAQVQALDQRGSQRKAVVVDSLYASVVFLAAFLATETVAVLVRLRNNQVLYEKPLPKPPGRKGAPRKHGAPFKLANPGRVPDQSETIALLGQTVRLQAWHALHFHRLAALVGLVLCVEFLRPDGTRRFRYPLWLFWSGADDLPLADLCRMYLWRFAIEHAFRFLKQHLGLNANQSTNLQSIEHWMWLCALAYTQLLLMRHQVVDLRPPWQRHPPSAQPHPLTPGQVQRAAARFLLRLGTPAAPPRPAGKGTGRRTGFRPKPKTRFKVVCKTKKRLKTRPKPPI
jgi:DDE superfamily endonuclease